MLSRGFSRLKASGLAGNRQGIIATCESALICSQHYGRKAGFAPRLYWILMLILTSPGLKERSKMRPT